MTKHFERFQDDLPNIARIKDWPKEGRDYFDIDLMYRDPARLSEMAQEIALHFIGNADIVLTTETGAVIGGKVASHLFVPLVIARENSPVKSVKARGTTEGGCEMTMCLGTEDITKGDCVLLITDVLHDSMPFKLLSDLTTVLGGTVIGTAALLETSGVGRAAYPKTFVLGTIKNV